MAQSPPIREWGGSLEIISLCPLCLCNYYKLDRVINSAKALFLPAIPRYRGETDNERRHHRVR